MSGHTPTPWATDGRWIVREVEGRKFWPGQPYLADCFVSESHETRGAGNTKANCEFICRAVNSHDTLVAALKSFLTFIECAKSGGLKPKADYSQFATEIYVAQKALALAEGKEPK